MHPREIKKDIYWVGAIDWTLRNFHGYTTYKGSTYNAYLIVDEKIALIDTVKEAFADELLERVSKIVDPAKIDYLISNHVEMDHSGSIPKIMSAAPNAKLITSAPQGIKGLAAHYGDYDYQGVKTGDSISLGKRTIRFVTTPMLHWPDNMVSYCPEEKILFSNDAFGQHLATSERFDDELALDEVMEQAKKYYGNIVMPYATSVKNAYDAVSGLDIDVIAPSHGILWRGHIADILENYRAWSSNEVKQKALVVFDSMWHSTEKIAKVITEAFMAAGVNARFIDLKDSHISDIMTELVDAKYICVGSSTLNSNMLPTVAAFLTYMKGLSPKHRKAMAFGSYGWGGQSVAQVEEGLKDCGFELFMDKIRVQFIPSDKILQEIAQLVTSAVGKK